MLVFRRTSPSTEYLFHMGDARVDPPHLERIKGLLPEVFPPLRGSAAPCHLIADNTWVTRPEHWSSTARSFPLPGDVARNVADMLHHFISHSCVWPSSGRQNSGAFARVRKSVKPEKICVVVGSNKVGKERLLIRIAQVLSRRVSVTEERYRALQCGLVSPADLQAYFEVRRPHILVVFSFTSSF